jgi:hypothetical protein
MHKTFPFGPSHSVPLGYSAPWPANRVQPCDLFFPLCLDFATKIIHNAAAVFSATANGVAALAVGGDRDTK